MEDRTVHALIGAAISGTSAVTSFLESHISMIAGLVAIVAGAYSICSARETIKYRRAQRKKLEENDIDD